MTKNRKVYAYYIINTKESGILHSWEECRKKTEGKKARYKSFKDEKEAHKWLSEGAEYNFISEKEKYELDKEGIYFDAGTGRGIGVEVRLTDYRGVPLLYKVLDSSKINEFGNYRLSEGRTNNFGELTGLFAALKYAEKYSTETIFGDSSLVIDYWSKGRYNSEVLSEDTVKLIKKVTLLRKKFESGNGTVKKISGDINPADLGFHK